MVTFKLALINDVLTMKLKNLAYIYINVLCVDVKFNKDFYERFYRKMRLLRNLTVIN